MFSATKVAAVTATLALAGSLVLVAGPLTTDQTAPGGAAIEMPIVDSATWFSGTGVVRIEEVGTETVVDGVPHIRGRVSSMAAETIEVNDPRAAGTSTWTQDGADYGSWGPIWGTFRVEDDDGAWVGEMTGVWNGSGNWFAGWLTGEGAYEGLMQYRHYDFTGGSTLSVRFFGLTMSAAAPPFAPYPSPSD